MYKFINSSDIPCGLQMRFEKKTTYFHHGVSIMGELDDASDSVGHTSIKCSPTRSGRRLELDKPMLQPARPWGRRQLSEANQGLPNPSR
jgi:hypothetical protein